MDISKNIKLDNYSDKASDEFTKMLTRLSEIGDDINNRMNGITLGNSIKSLIGSLFWIAFFVVFIIVVDEFVNAVFMVITMICAMLLMAFMLLDNILNISYYGNIHHYENALNVLKKRISNGFESLTSNYDAFMLSKDKMWNFPLSVGKSIPDEAINIVDSLSKIESLKKGFINGAKNFLYYVTIICFTVTTCVALFTASSSIMMGISGTDIDETTLIVLNIIAMILVVVGEILLAKFAWSKSECKVNNLTLFVLFAGPVAFLLLILIATLLVLLFIGIFSVMIYIILGTIVLGFIISCLSNN